jgi:tetratricopeptide (TPR) repeat protein
VLKGRLERTAAVAVVALLLSALAGGCGKRVAVPIPEGEDYVRPAVAPREVSPPEAKALDEAWRDVLSGDAASATRRYQKLLARRPDLAPSRTGLAYARLRAGRLQEAASAFASVLADRPEDVSALVGAGSAAFRRGDLDAAVALYRSAQALAPDDAVVRRRLTTLKLQATERRMGLAQAALDRGDAEAAAREYSAALETAPEVAGVRLALADLLAARGDVAAALTLLEADPSGDRQVRLRHAALLMDQQEFGRAAEIYRGLLTSDPADTAAREGEKAAREGLELLSMPEEYRLIPDAPRVTRAELAALVAVRVHALRRLGPGEPRVALDIGASWAREQVARVLALGIMEVYPNHTFQPGAVVRRVDLARAAARVLERLGWPRSAGPAPADMSPSHLDYEAVARVLGAGLMELAPSGAFEPWRPVSGREALDVVDGLARLAGS